MALSGSFANSLAPYFRDVVGTTFERWPSFYSQHYHVETSDSAYEDYMHAAGLPIAVSRPEGTPTPFYDPIEGSTKRLTHEEFGIGVQISRELMMNDKRGAKGPIRTAASSLSRSMIERVEVDGADVYLNGHTSYTTIDNVALFSASHTRLDGGANQSNFQGTGAAPSETTIDAAMQQFESWYDERGLRVVDRPRDIIVSPYNAMAARKALGSSYAFDPGNTANWASYNAINTVYGALNLLVWPYLGASETRWYVRSPNHTIMWLWRERPVMDAYDDKNTRVAKFAMFMQYSKGPIYWQGIYQNDGA
jgi:hypothetical protein